MAYGRDVTRALDLIQRGSREFASNPGGGTLSLAILPAFGTRWLAPRLSKFLVKHPGITINLATRVKRFNFDAESFDAAIHFGSDDWRDSHHMKLFEEVLTACISPARLADHPIADVVDMAGLPLLQLESRPNAWSVWFAAQGNAPANATGMLFDQFATMTQAAISGLGVALLPDYLAEIEIVERRLLPVLKKSTPGPGSYWLVWPRSRANYPPLEAFREWLAVEVQVETS